LRGRLSPHLYPPPPFGRGRIKEGVGIPFIKNNAVKLCNYGNKDN